MKYVANYSVLNRILPIALIAVLSASCEEDNDSYYNGNYTLAKTKMTRSLENQPTAPVKPMSYYKAGSWTESKCQTVCNRLMEFNVSVSWEEGMFPNRITKSAISLGEPEASYCILSYTFKRKVDWVGVFKEIDICADIAVMDTLHKKSGNFSLETALKPDMKLFEVAY